MWVECLPMVRETWVQSQVESYQRLLEWYLISPCLTLSNIRYVSRVKWNNQEKGVAPSPTPRCRSYWKGSLLVALDYGHQLYLDLIKKNAIGINNYLQTTSESLTSLFERSSFKLVNAAIILAFSSSLLLHGILLASRSTSPYI